jgi:hypothetical protein
MGVQIHETCIWTGRRAVPPSLQIVNKNIRAIVGVEKYHGYVYGLGLAKGLIETGAAGGVSPFMQPSG